MTANLLPHHVNHLHASAISEAVIDARGYSSVSRPTPGDQRPRDTLQRLGMPAWARNEDVRFPGLLIPVYRATGELVSHQYRPDKAPPDPAKPGKVRKYAMQAGRPAVLDVHPFSKDKIIDPTVQLFLTEGVKKADALTSQGLCAVALSGVWNWRSSLGSLGDWEDIPLRGRHVIIIYDSDARDNEGVRQAMERLGRWLRSKGTARVSYVITPALPGQDKTGLDDFLAAGGTLEALFAGGSDKPPVPDKTPGLDPEGWMVEDLVAEALDGRWLWSPGLGWLTYEPANGRWKPLGQDKDAAICETVRAWLTGKYRETAAALSEAARREAPGSELKDIERQAAQWRTAASRTRIANLAALARGQLMRDAEDFDTHPDLLNTPSGVVSLRTGQAGPHDPGLLFTQVTAARYVPGARHPDLDKALEAVPADARDYLALRYGQAITGDPPPDDKVLVQLGRGSNGKTTLVSAASGALGDYFRVISDRAVITDKSQHPTELMDFRGARLAVLEELPEDRQLNMRRIKTVTGPVITARYCGQDSTPFSTSHALVISTNHDPVVLETDHGSWRRLLALRFPYKYREPADMPAEPGPDDRAAETGLRERLRDGQGGRAEAVLAWLVANAVRWYAGEPGRDPQTFGPAPDRMRSDTRAWQAQSNPMFAYVTEELAADPGGHVRSADLSARFTCYLAGAGHPRWSERTIAARLAECCDALGWHVVKRSTKQGAGHHGASYAAWHGIRFKTDADRAAETATARADGALTSGVAGVASHLPTHMENGQRKSDRQTATPATPHPVSAAVPWPSPGQPARPGLRWEPLARSYVPRGDPPTQSVPSPYLATPPPPVTLPSGSLACQVCADIPGGCTIHRG